MKLIRWFQLRFCDHEARAENIRRISPVAVEVQCERCGKVLTACYGLALPVRWL